MKSTELLRSFEQQQTSSGKRAWKSIGLTSYRRWISDLYEELQERGYAKAQGILISDDALTLGLTQCAPDDEVLKHVAVVQEAWALAWQWDLWPVWEDITSTENGRLCKRWLEALRVTLRSNELITNAELDHIVVEAIESGELKLPPVTFFQLFEPYRMQNRLIRALKNKEIPVRFENQIQPQESHGALTTFASPEEELNAIGTWARKKLSELGDSARIGIVAPTWPVHVIRRQFESSFPELHDIGRLVNTSESRCLGDTPIWREIDTFLRWSNGPLHYSELVPLQNSSSLPELNIPTSFEPWYGEYISLPQFARRTNNEKIQEILRTLQITRSSNRPRRTSFAKHVENLIAVLQLAGWQTADLDSFTFVVQIAIAKTLETVSKNSGLLEDASWRDFVGFLREIGISMPLEENNDKAPIQVLSVAASRGLQFDALWVSGMSDSQWPKAVIPNAMIPLQMQKEAQIHRTSPHDELRYAQALMTSWHASCNDIVFSYSNETEDTKAEHSKLIELEESAVEAILEKSAHVAAQNHPWELIRFDGQIETYSNHKASKLSLNGEQKGSTSLLSNQANCPFRAWAENRLQLLANQPETPQTFPDATGRGSYFHLLMEALSEGRKDKQDFLKLRSQTDRIEEVIDAILSDESPSLPPLFIEREKEILLRIMNAWLETLTTDQYPDFTLFRTEAPDALTIGNFVFWPRVDKVQINSEGEVEVIDYKTGSVNPSEWNPARLDPASGYRVDTQMAIYSQLKFDIDDDTPSAVESIGYEVVSTTDAKADDSIEGVRINLSMLRDLRFFKHEFDSDFTKFREHWHAKLVQLTKDYVGGEANATPRSQVCDYCELKNLCRQFEIRS